MSRKTVEARMVQAERADRRMPDPGDARPLTWPQLYVADAEARRALKLWIWCEAGGHAFSAVCARRGLSYTTALRHKNNAVDRIVLRLNLQALLGKNTNAGRVQKCALPVDSG